MPSNPRRLCVVTGSRAEYGLLFWLMRAIDDDEALELQLVVCGSHLVGDVETALARIRQDGFEISGAVDMVLASDSPSAVSRSIGLGVIGFADTFDRLRPDGLVLLGDRYETFAAAIAATNALIPIAHIAGGEASEGAVDEAMRHSITKMALYHFPAGTAQTDRIIQLGEDPARVFALGKPGLDQIHRLELLDIEDLQVQLGIRFHERLLVVTYHPTTLQPHAALDEVEALLEALDGMSDSTLIFTSPNRDASGTRARGLMESFVRARPERTAFFESLGQLLYLSCVKHADAVVGNSSSGLIEAPALGVPTVNIGDRQRGRVSAESVIDCESSAPAIRSAIDEALSDAFQLRARTQSPPFASDGAISERIKDKLKDVDLSKEALKKSFYRLGSPTQPASD